MPDTFSLNAIPTYSVPLIQGNKTSSVWYRFLTNFWNGVAPEVESAITLGASPYSFVSPFRGFLIVRGGTVSAIQFTRSVTTLTGLTAGIFPLNQGDTLTITYTVLPTVTFVPQ